MSNTIAPISLPAKLRALALLRCPACRVGAMFRSPVHMNARCPHCNYQFDKGNGYFLGAMYASYGLSLAVCGIQTIALLLGGASTLVTVIAAICTACLVGPCFAFRIRAARGFGRNARAICTTAKKTSRRSSARTWKPAA